MPARTPQELAFERFVVPEIDVLFRAARSLTGSAVDAEDLVQDTLVRAFRAIERFDGSHPRAWLLTILRNAQRNRVRRVRPVPVADPDDADHVHGPGLADDPAEEATRRAFDGAVRRALTALSPAARVAVELVDVEGLTSREAADVLGIPVGTVMSRVHRARKEMRASLRRSGVDLSGGQA